jgi:hypothetical protein
LSDQQGCQRNHAKNLHHATPPFVFAARENEKRAGRAPFSRLATLPAGTRAIEAQRDPLPVRSIIRFRRQRVNLRNGYKAVISRAFSASQGAPLAAGGP